MTNTSDRMDLAFEFQAGLTSSGLTESDRFLETVKAFVHFGSLTVTCLFTCLIIATVRQSKELRQNPSYILLCLHCTFVTCFNLMGAVVHGLRGLRWPISRIACWIFFDVQILMARGLMITLTLMSLNISLSICMPLRYPVLVHRFHRWVALVACVLALLNPVVFTILACVRFPWVYVVGLDTECSSALEGTACIVSALGLLLLLVLLIVISYVAIYLEGRRAGHFVQSNCKGRRTILIHSLQMSLHILPSIIIITRHKQSLPVAMAIFIIFSFAQSLSPVVFGLRCKELTKEMPHSMTCFWGTCSQIESMDISSTGTITSAETRASRETNAFFCVDPSTPSAIIAICEVEKERSELVELRAGRKSLQYLSVPNVPGSNPSTDRYHNCGDSLEQGTKPFCSHLLRRAGSECEPQVKTWSDKNSRDVLCIYSEVSKNTF